MAPALLLASLAANALFGLGDNDRPSSLPAGLGRKPLLWANALKRDERREERESLLGSVRSHLRSQLRPTTDESGESTVAVSRGAPDLQVLNMGASATAERRVQTASRIKRRRRRGPAQPADFESRPPVDPKKKRMLMLISDTGGGHRASAQAVEAMIKKSRRDIDISVVDIWTDYGTFPMDNFVRDYKFLAKNPRLWQVSWHFTALRPIEVAWDAIMQGVCYHRFRQCMLDYDPDMVVSLHPLTQQLPLKVLNDLQGGERKVPFATIVTDLGSAHPTWLNKGVDACFVPSDVVCASAKRRGLKARQLRQHGLPVRPAFWEAAPPRSKLLRELGLSDGRKTVLVVGGGDGVGSLKNIVEATASTLSKECPNGAQVVAVCGKNARLQAQLEAREWGEVDVVVRGFVKRMSDYMEVADCLVTKAGPGTIAEAAIRGLPTMLSSYLPGQEAGNVPFVTGSGFGEYTRDPNDIARRVSQWIQDPEKLEQLSSAARAAATPQATQEIAEELCVMLDDFATDRHKGLNPATP